jgi:hypothetical protein
MLIRLYCPSCHAIVGVLPHQAGELALCPLCRGRFRVPDQPSSSSAKTKLAETKLECQPRAVHYLHHTRDPDGDVVFFFNEAGPAAQEPKQSSPILWIRRKRTATIDRGGNGALCRYAIHTQNSLYEVQIPRDKADHLAKEIGGFLAELVGEKG